MHSSLGFWGLAFVLALLGLSVGVTSLPHETDWTHKNFVARAAANNTHQYLTNATAPFAVDGANLPDIPFDIGESYAGLLPIDDSTTGRELFFWFVPSTNPAAADEIVIWLNGGPGCSSLMGFLQENGPISWQAGTYAPVPNVYSWSNLTNVVWVEQPAGTAFSGADGDANATNEIDVAAQFLGFWKNFMTTFDLQGRKVSITGESYAGNYVPYIAEAMLNQTGPDFASYYNVSGILIYDPILGDSSVAENAPVVNFVTENRNLFAFGDDDLEFLTQLSTDCGYQDMMAQANVFPPAGPIGIPPAMELNATDSSLTEVNNASCNTFAIVYNILAIAQLNPCFNIYYVGDVCPFPGDVLGDPYHAQPAGSPEIYFDRPDVQTAIHAPAVGTEWSLCSDRTHIFVDADDRSPPSATNGGPLGHVIERTNNVIVGHGLLDMVLMAEGSLLALQNLTWNGARGFSSGLDHDLLVPYYPQGVLPQSGNGTLGSWTEDRGLTFSTVVLSGHEVPGYQPGAAYRHLEKLLGRIARLDEPSNFTTAGLWFGPDEIVYERTILPARPMLQRRR